MNCIRDHDTGKFLAGKPFHSSGFRLLGFTILALLLAVGILPSAAAQETAGPANITASEGGGGGAGLSLPNTTETEQRAHDLTTKGVRCSYAGNYTCAVESFEAAHLLLPGDPTILYNHAVVLVYMKKYDEALEKIDAAILLTPDDAYLWYAKGTIQKTAGDFAGSGESYGRAQQLDPSLGITALDLYPANIIVTTLAKNTTVVVLLVGFSLLGIYIWYNERRA